MSARGGDGGTPKKRSGSIRGAELLQRTGSGYGTAASANPMGLQRLQSGPTDGGKGRRGWLTLAVLSLAVGYCLCNAAMFASHHFGRPQGMISVRVKRRFDRGSRSWSKHMREIMNHTNAWDYGAIWDPLMQLEKKMSMSAFQTGTSDGSDVDESICQRPLAAHLLKRASPPELTIRKLRSRMLYSKPSVRIAFVLFAHNIETLLGAERVLQWMYHPDHTFVFHVDSKSPMVFLCYLRQKYDNVKNVHIGPRARSAWGSYGVVQAEVSALRLAMKVDENWDVAMPISGGSLPIKSREQIYCHIKGWQDHIVQRMREEGATDVDPRIVSIIPTQEKHALHPENPQKNANQLRTNATCTAEECDNTPGNLPWYKGSQWHIVGRHLVNFTLTDPSAQAWLEFFASPKFTLAPDESWVNTIAKYSPYRESTVFARKAGAMLALWNGNDCTSHRNPRPNQSPCYMGMHDWRDLETSDKIFARKFLFNDHVIPRIWSELVDTSSMDESIATC